MNSSLSLLFLELAFLGEALFKDASFEFLAYDLTLLLLDYDLTLLTGWTVRLSLDDEERVQLCIIDTRLELLAALSFTWAGLDGKLESLSNLDLPLYSLILSMPDLSVLLDV